MTELEERIRRAVAVREFDGILMFKVRAFEAQQRHIDRLKQWARYMTPQQRNELLRGLKELKNAKQVFRLDTTSEWMQQYPDFRAPSFTPSAIRKRVSRRRIFEEYHRVEHQDIYMEELKRLLNETQEMLDESSIE